MGGHKILRRDGHAAVVMGAAVENVTRLEIRDAKQGVVGRSLIIVSVRGTLGHAVESEAKNFIRFAGTEQEEV